MKSHINIPQNFRQIPMLNGETVYIPEDSDKLYVPYNGLLETGETVFIKPVLYDPLRNSSAGYEIERTEKVSSLLGEPKLKGIFGDSRVVIRSMVMEKLYPYIFTMESVSKLIGDLKILHKNNIFHKDINPTNIMQNKDKQAVFIDFAIDKHASFFYPTDRDEDKWQEYDLKALGKVLFVFKHIEKINNYFSTKFSLDIKGRERQYFENEFYKFECEFGRNDDNILTALKDIAFPKHEKHELDSIDEFLLDIINGKIRDINLADERASKGKDAEVTSTIQVPSPSSVPEEKKSSSLIQPTIGKDITIDGDKGQEETKIPSKDISHNKINGQKVVIYPNDLRTLRQIYAEEHIDPNEGLICMALDGTARIPFSREYDDVSFQDAFKEITKTFRDQNLVHHFEFWGLSLANRWLEQFKSGEIPDSKLLKKDISPDQKLADKEKDAEVTSTIHVSSPSLVSEEKKSSSLIQPTIEKGITIDGDKVKELETEIPSKDTSHNKIPGQRVSVFRNDLRTLRQIYAEEHIDPNEGLICMALDDGSRIPFSREYDNVSFQDAFKEITKTLRDQDLVHHFEFWGLSVANSWLEQFKSGEIPDSKLLKSGQKLADKEKDTVLSLPLEEKKFQSLIQLQPAIEKETPILIPEYLQEAIAYVSEKFLGTPYTGAFKDEQIYSSDGTEIPRPNHGLAHSLRKVAYIPLIIDFHKKYCAPEYAEKMANYTPEKIKILQIAALFSVAGRKDETGFADNKELYRSYRQESADAFEAYCEDHNLLTDQEEIAHYKTVVLEMGNTAWLYNEGKNPYHPGPERSPSIDDHFLHIAHSMDLFRLVSSTTSLKNLYASFTKNGYCTGGYQGEYHKDLIQLLQFPATAIKSMGSRLSWRIKDDGKIVSSFINYNEDIFAKTNTDPVVAVTTLNNLPLPTFIKKEVTNLPVGKKDKHQIEFESHYLNVVKNALESCEGDPKVEIFTPEDKLPYLKIFDDKRKLLAYRNALKEGEIFGFDATHDPLADYLILTIKTIKTTRYETIPLEFLGGFWKLYKKHLNALPLEEASVEISSPSPPLEKKDDQQTKEVSDSSQPKETTTTSLVVEKAITLSHGTAEDMSPLSEIKKEELECLKKHKEAEDQAIVDFYIKYKDDANKLREVLLEKSPQISDELLVAACNILGIDSNINTLKKEARSEKQEDYLKKIDKGFREQSRANHPDRRKDKGNDELKKLAETVMAILADAKEVLLALPKQCLSEDIQNFAKQLAKIPPSQMKAFVADPATQERLTSINKIADLMITLSDLRFSDNNEVFWTSSWVSTEFFNSLPRLIKTASDLSSILFLLPQDQKKAFWELPGMMDLAADVLRPDNLVKLFIGFGEEDFKLLPPSIFDLNLILLHFPTDKIMPFLKLSVMQERLPGLIKNKSHVEQILETLQTEGKQEAHNFIHELPFVKEINKEAEDKVKSKEEFIKTNHPDLIEIQAAIKQCLKIRTEINEGTHANPGYHTRVIGYGGPEFLALLESLKTCSQEYGLRLKPGTKGDEQLLAIWKDPSTPLKSDFPTKLKTAYDKALPIEYHKMNLSMLKHAIEGKTKLAVENFPSSKEGVNYLKITGSQQELVALSKTVASLKEFVETDCTLQDGYLLLDLISSNSILKYEFYGAFEKGYEAKLVDQKLQHSTLKQEVNKDIKSKINENIVPPIIPVSINTQTNEQQVLHQHPAKPLTVPLSEQKSKIQKEPDNLFERIKNDEGTLEDGNNIINTLENNPKLLEVQNTYGQTLLNFIIREAWVSSKNENKSKYLRDLALKILKNPKFRDHLSLAKPDNQKNTPLHRAVYYGDDYSVIVTEIIRITRNNVYETLQKLCKMRNSNNERPIDVFDKDKLKLTANVRMLRTAMLFEAIQDETTKNLEDNIASINELISDDPTVLASKNDMNEMTPLFFILDTACKTKNQKKRDELEGIAIELLKKYPQNYDNLYNINNNNVLHYAVLLGDEGNKKFINFIVDDVYKKGGEQLLNKLLHQKNTFGESSYDNDLGSVLTKEVYKYIKPQKKNTSTQQTQEPAVSPTLSQPHQTKMTELNPEQKVTAAVKKESVLTKNSMLNTHGSTQLLKSEEKKFVADDNFLLDLESQGDIAELLDGNDRLILKRIQIILGQINARVGVHDPKQGLKNRFSYMFSNGSYDKQRYYYITYHTCRDFVENALNVGANKRDMELAITTFKTFLICCMQNKKGNIWKTETGNDAIELLNINFNKSHEHKQYGNENVIKRELFKLLGIEFKTKNKKEIPKVTYEKLAKALFRDSAARDMAEQVISEGKATLLDQLCSPEKAALPDKDKATLPTIIRYIKHKK